MMKMSRGFFLVAIFTVVMTVSGFSDTADLATQLAEGIKCHDAARIDPETNIKRGEEILSAIQDESPVAKAYYGSLITLEAEQYAAQKDVLKALELLSGGTKLMDAAIKIAPDVSDIRFLRMENSYEISQSSPLNRYKVMKQDIDWLDARKADFSMAEQGVIELYKGLYFARAKKLDAAMDAFDECIRLSPGSPEAIEAQRQIAHYAE
jgi:tetratricopeptide (TPR) repeat protein